MRLTLAFGLFCVLLLSPDAVAQTRDSHWGVSAAVVPRWSFPDTLADIWDIETDMSGSEFRVGVVRGSDLGGDVGVSFVKKTVDDDAVVNLREPACVELPGGRTQCARGAYDITSHAGFTGFEAHLFAPLKTIRQRVQLGLELAGGIARIDGTSDRFVEHLVISGSSVTASTDAVGEVPFKRSLQDLPQDWSVIPIGRVAFGVGVIVRPGVKLRASAGVNFPGYHYIAFHAQYLFGAR
jgi:hypothetical protein